MLKPDSPRVILLLAAVVALGPLATDMYLPAMPSMGQALGAGAGEIQLTLSVYMAGFALAQLICGPLADRFGRKPILLGGFVLFTAASIGCALSDGVETLLVFRFLQALGGSTGPVLGRAAVRDLYPPGDAARVMALLASIMALAPAVAPLIGGALMLVAGWESIFLLLAVYSALMVVIIALALPEPLPLERRQPLNPGRLVSNYRTILSSPTFLGYAFTNACVFAGLFAFLSGSPFVLIDFLGVRPEHYGLYFAVSVGGFITGNLMAVRLGRRRKPNQLLRLGLYTTTLSGCVMAGLALAGVFTIPALMIPQIVFMVGVGLTLPQTMAGALANFPQMAGSASAMFGFIQMTLAALAGMLVGQLHTGTSLSMTLVIAGAGIGAAASHHFLSRHHPAPGFA